MKKKLIIFRSVMQRIYALKWIDFTSKSMDERSVVYRGHKHYLRVTKSKCLVALRRCDSYEKIKSMGRKVLLIYLSGNLLTNTFTQVLLHCYNWYFIHKWRQMYRNNKVSEKYNLYKVVRHYKRRRQLVSVIHWHQQYQAKLQNRTNK